MDKGTIIVIAFLLLFLMAALVIVLNKLDQVLTKLYVLDKKLFKGPFSTHGLLDGIAREMGRKKKK